MLVDKPLVPICGLRRRIGKGDAWVTYMNEARFLERQVALLPILESSVDAMPID